MNTNTQALQEAQAREIFEIFQGWQTATFGWQGDPDPIIEANNYEASKKAHDDECVRRIAVVLSSHPPAPEHASGEQPLPEFFAELEYNTPDWDVLVSVYRRVADSTPVLVHQEKLKAQSATPTAEPAVEAVPKGMLSVVQREDLEPGTLEIVGADGLSITVTSNHISQPCRLLYALARSVLSASPAAPEADLPECKHNAHGWETAPEAAKPEQQAQAGEPEVYRLMSLRGMDEFITLQAHREAMEQARLKATYWEYEARRYASNADFWRDANTAKNVAIDKKDAALKACVEILVNAKNTVNASASPEHFKWWSELGAAITQAQEAL